ncbi:MAG: CoA transferase [Burkholderiales bacterium]|nr:CoA transferase [Burkholderiales bacterium]
MPHIPASSALANLRILDLTRVRAGPTCVKQFADFGADVIKIESPEPDTMSGPRHGFDMQNLHRNKRSLTLDMKAPEGKEILMKLVRTADVVVENFRPDVKFRLGIDYESLRAVNKRIILASISGFGQDGPYGTRPGFDQIAQGMGGFMSVTGFPGGGPVRAGTAIADLSGGMFAALGIFTALWERQTSGEGQWVQSSLLMAQIALMDFQAARYLMKGEVPGQAGNDHPTSMPTSAYKTRDGYVNIAASGQVMWKRLCEVMGRPELFAQAEFKDEPSRSKNRVALNEEITRATVTRNTAEWVETLNEAGVPCGPIYTVDQVFADPQVKHLGAAAPVQHPKLGEIRLVNQAVKLSRTPATMARATPEHSEHTAEILKEIGYDDAQIADLKARKVV